MQAQAHKIDALGAVLVVEAFRAWCQAASDADSQEHTLDGLAMADLVRVFLDIDAVATDLLETWDMIRAGRSARSGA